MSQGPLLRLVNLKDMTKRKGSAIFGREFTKCQPVLLSLGEPGGHNRCRFTGRHKLSSVLITRIRQPVFEIHPEAILPPTGSELLASLT